MPLRSSRRVWTPPRTTRRFASPVPGTDAEMGGTDPGPERDMGDEAPADMGSVPGHGADDLAGDEAQWAALQRARSEAEDDVPDPDAA